MVAPRRPGRDISFVIPIEWVHLPDGNQVVILEGLARITEDDELDEQAWQTLDTAFQSKYQVEEGSPYWTVHPTKVLAWDGADLQTMTRWLFG